MNFQTFSLGAWISTCFSKRNDYSSIFNPFFRIKTRANWQGQHGAICPQKKTW